MISVGKKAAQAMTKRLWSTQFDLPDLELVDGGCILTGFTRRSRLFVVDVCTFLSVLATSGRVEEPTGSGGFEPCGRLVMNSFCRLNIACPLAAPSMVTNVLVDNVETQRLERVYARSYGGVRK